MISLPSDALPGLQIGLGIFTGQTPAQSGISAAAEYRAVPEMAAAAEAAGYDSIWLSEHHGADDNYMPSMLPVAGAIAARTERITIGTAVLIPSFWHPVHLAEDVAVVDLMSGGRFVLGLGLGWREWEFKTFGVERRERAGRTAEMIEILRRLWTGEPVTHQGRYYQLDKAKVRPTPCRGTVPVFLAGSKEQPIRRAAKVADGLIYSITGPTAAAVQPSLDHVHSALAAADSERGTCDAAFPIILLLNVALSDGEPWTLIGRGVDHQYTAYAAWKAEDAGLPFGAGDAKDAALAGRKLIFSGTAAELTMRLRGWINAILPRRALHLVLKMHYPGVDHRATIQMMEKFAEQVLPALRGGLPSVPISKASIPV